MSSADQLDLADLLRDGWVTSRLDAMFGRIRAARNLDQSGRERIDMWLGDRAELDVIERRDDVRRLDALLGRRALLARLRQLGALTDPVRSDLDLIDFERRALPHNFGRDLGRFTRASTSTTMLELARERRRKRAREIAARSPPAAFDASNNDLLPLLFLDGDDHVAREQLLADTLVQLRALRRSPELVDARNDGVDDNSQGRLSTSGVLASLEQALVCQQISTRTPARERTLTRLCVIHAPHLAPSTIYEASNLTLELLGRDDAGLRVLGRGFENVYGAIHTVYSADTPTIVRSFIVDELCAGLPPEHAIELLARAVDAWRDPAATGAFADRVPEPRAFLAAHCRLPKLTAAPADVQLSIYSKLIRLYETVCAGAPSTTSILRDAGFAGRAAPQVLRLVHAMRALERTERPEGQAEGRRGALARVLAAGIRARDALARAFFEIASGERRARLWRLDRDVEYVIVSALGSALHANLHHHDHDDDVAAAFARRARGAAKRAVMQSGLHTLVSSWRASSTRAPPPQLIAAEVRRLFDARARAIHFAGIRVLLDPRFVDRLIKESTLHAWLDLASSYRPTVRINARANARATDRVNVRIDDRIRVRVVVAPREPTFTVRVVRRSLRPGEALPVDDGVAAVFDEKHAPPGYSHAAVLARDRGAGLLVVNDLARITRAHGRPMHLVDGELRAGPAPRGVRRREGRKARPVLFAPDLVGALSGAEPVSLRSLANVALAERRAIAGEKASVLADLLAGASRRFLDEAGARTLDGLVIPFASVAQWLREVGLFRAWMTETLTSRKVRSALRAQPRTLELARDACSFPVIVRSSGSAEDRPGKSDAGVALSVGAVRSKHALTRAMADVVAATWSERSLEAQRRAGVPMRRVWPALLVQSDLSARALLSGVAMSRGRDGAYGAISYQCVRGAGGAVAAVRGGAGAGVTEGFISPVEHAIVRGAPLLSQARARALGRAVLAIEAAFHEVIEPGQGHAVDVEWLFDRQGLVIVQARVMSHAA